jgi:hypothetical protein
MPRILHQTRQQRARRATAYNTILDRIFRPAPSPMPVVCVHCHQPQSKVTSNRLKLIAQYQYPSMCTAREACICCDPGSTHTCPTCNSEDLAWTFDHDEACELAHCNACQWTGEATEAAPPAQPWNELEAVAMADPEERVRRGYEDLGLSPRIPVAIEEDEMERAVRYGHGDYLEVA